MKIKKFLHFHLSIDSRRDEIMNLISKMDEQNKSNLLTKEVSSLFKNRCTQYIPWLINNTKQDSEEMADSIFKDMVEHS
jgi:hypothetical protein